MERENGRGGQARWRQQIGQRRRQGAAGTDKVSVVDGPFAETKEVIGGYFILEAKDYAEAAELSKSCPHLAFGGKIELRQIESM